MPSPRILNVVQPPSKPCGKCCEDFNIDPLHLLDIDRLPPSGREYVETIGVAAMSIDERVKLLLSGTRLPTGNVHVTYRCTHLTEEKLCDIYEHRPQICREFNCESRADRLCGGGVQ